uniref:Uncharacterized protein n=1 Tax=Tanacetum cinerariifolium TaxID=118510 RepID=A0A6L2P4D3_TANCI|nr:hypothetical protein [Tanacetum cinerariifolium]
MRDFHKTHPSGSGTITKTAPSAAKIKPSITNDGTGVKLGVSNVTEQDLSESEAESWRNDEDDSNNKQHSSGEDSDQENDSDDDKTQSDNENESNSEHETDESESSSESDHEENKEDEDDEEEVKDEFIKTPSNDSDDEDETKITDRAEGDEDEEMGYTTSQLYDDVDIRLNEPVNNYKGFAQEEGTDAAMTNVQQGNENPKILQVIEDAHVTLSTVPQKTEVSFTSSSHSSDMAAKFLNSLDIPHTYAKIVFPMDVHIHHKVPSQQTPTLLTVVIFDSSQMVKESLEDVVLAKESSQLQSSYEVAATLTEFELKKSLIDKIDKSESYLAASKHRECYEGLIKSYELDNENHQMSPVKVAYDKYALWGISHWIDQRKSFYGYARGLESTHDVYSTKRILVVTRVEIMRKHGYGYLKEIVVRRADNDLYKFKEGDFLRLCINEIEDMLILVVQNRLTNLLGDDVFEFAIALRMFTRSIVIQNRVEDLQLAVKSYQKKINVTKPESTKLSIRKKDPYTSYQDPQGFIYVDTLWRHRLMRS